MKDFHFQLAKVLGVVPIFQVPGVEYAKPLAKALIEGGIPLAEVMLRNEYGIEAIRAMKEEYPQMCVGAGTVLTSEQLKKAEEAGADFIVAPGFDKEIVKEALELNLPVLPGCMTPTEVNEARKLGLDVFKFFPVRTAGGIDAVAEISGPYEKAEFIVTGGMTMEDIGKYLACDKIIAVGGGFVTPDEMILRKDWKGIEALCKKAVGHVMNFHLVHVGINGKSKEEGEKMARRFADVFALPYQAGEKSDFGGSIIEFCKMKFPGKAGHIAIGTPSVERAMAYMERKGVPVRKEFKNTGEDGKIIAAYLEEEFGGFAVHLLRHS